jgi:hypothetical protein
VLADASNLLQGWGGFAASVVVIAGAIYGIGRWGRRRLTDAVASDLREIREQVKPNGGESPTTATAVQRSEALLEDIRIEIGRVTGAQALMNGRLDTIGTRLDQHIGQHQVLERRQP